MLSRSWIALGLALILTLAFNIPAPAGGWAVIVLDELPTHVLAGQPLTIGFTVLQHGRTPMAGLTPTITARIPKSKDVIVAAAKPEGKVGHYSATLTFPGSGNWEWSIQAFTMDQPMPTLRVAASAAPPAAMTEQAASSFSGMYLASMLGFAAGLAGLVMVFRRRTRWAAALTALGFLVGSALAVAAADPGSKAVAQSESFLPGNSSPSQVELGGQLFIAKGCVTCHINNRIENLSEFSTISAGPDLSTFSASPEYLRLRLRDPSLVKADTQMPNLGLSEVEIEALIAFINSK